MQWPPSQRHPDHRGTLPPAAGDRVVGLHVAGVSLLRYPHAPQCPARSRPLPFCRRAAAPDRPPWPAPPERRRRSPAQPHGLRPWTRCMPRVEPAPRPTAPQGRPERPERPRGRHRLHRLHRSTRPRRPRTPASGRHSAPGAPMVHRQECRETPCKPSHYVRHPPPRPFSHPRTPLFECECAVPSPP